MDSCEYWIAVCEKLNEAHRFENTVERLGPYIERDVDRPWAYFIYGCALLRLERLAEAEEALRTSYAASPDSFAYAFYLAQALLGQNRNDEALEVIEPALEADPDNPDLNDLKSRIEESMRK